LPPPPSIVSLPLPPSTKSLPSPALTMSLPPPERIRSLPLPVVMMSAPSVPSTAVFWVMPVLVVVPVLRLVTLNLSLMAMV
jgi:hypothetical protein